MSILKLSIKWSILGFFLPIIGILIGYLLLKKNEILARSIRRGSAISSVIIIIIGSILMYYFLFK